MLPDRATLVEAVLEAAFGGVHHWYRRPTRSPTAMGDEAEEVLDLEGRNEGRYGELLALLGVVERSAGIRDPAT